MKELFNCLTQVAGRSAEAKKKGKYLIQTQNHKHFVLQKVLDNNYNDFYQNEILLRRQNHYPPFSRIGLVEVKNEDEQKAKQAVNDFHKRLNKFSDRLLILPPNEAIIAKDQRYLQISDFDKKFEEKQIRMEKF